MIRLAKRYELDVTIGQGGMGTVFKARDTETGEWVAAKRLKPEAVKHDPQLLERFEREGDALRRLNHPNIVKVLATIEQDNHHYILLEYVGGGDLGDMLKARGRLSIERTLQIGIELSDALTRAHYLNIIHRDIKPANVLMGEDGVPKLTDFGVAHIGGAGDMTGVGLSMGTPDYMAPEAVNGEEIDERTDIWSLGVMLYEMLTGKHPFRGEVLTATLVNVLTLPLPDIEAARPEIPVALVDLIGRMLQKDRTTRISSVRLVGAELEAIMRGRHDVSRTTVTTPISIPTLDESRFETPTPATSAPKHNLPARTTTFVGREEEVHEISHLLAQHDTRLVTLLGQGGMGKTRLAIHAAEILMHAFDGTYFVALASLPNADTIPNAVADAVGYGIQNDGRSPAQQVSDYLREKSMLLIFDNFEQVLAGANFVSDLLRAAPRLKVMTTSRERLNLTGETIVALGGLDFPDAVHVADAMHYSAVQLFVQTARRSSPGFNLSESDLKHVARICRSVDGLPLGVMLAASWTDSLSVVEIADEITRSLDFLESELRDLPARHRSMRAVFDYSWALLGESEQAVFIKLSIFKGGFTRDAAQAVTGATLRTLTMLQNKSLLRRNPDSGRYELHELVSQYAAEKLAADPSANDAAMTAHAEFYTAFLVKRSDVYMNPGQELKTLGEIEAERDNIRTTWTYAIECDRLEMLSQSIGIVAMFFEAKGLAQEGSEVFHEIASAMSQLPNPDPILIARAKVYGAQMEIMLGDYDHATHDALEALDVFTAQGLMMDISKAHKVLAYIAMNNGQYEDARMHLEQSVKAIERSENKYAAYLINRGEATLAYVMFLQGEYSNSEALSRKLIAVAEREKMFYGVSFQYNNLGETLHAQGRDDEARPLIQKALDSFIEVKNLRWQAVALVNLGLIEHSASQFPAAETYFRRALALYKEIGDRRGVAEALNRLGGTVYWYGKYHEAIDLHQKAYDLFTELGNPKGAADALVLCSIAENAVGLYEDGQKHLDIAFELRGKLGNMTDIADVQQMIAINAMYRGAYDEALQYVEQANDIFDSISESDTIQHSSYNMLTGIINAEAGRFDIAIPLLEESIKSLEQHKVYWALAQGMGVLGLSYIGSERLTDALTVLRQALEYAVIAKTTDWAMLSVLGSGWAIALRGNPITGVEYISYVLNVSNTQVFIRNRANWVLEQIRPLLSEPELAAAIERGKTLTYEDVVSAITGRPS